MAKTIVGLDIGSEMLRAVEVEGGRSGRSKVLRHHEVAVPEGAVKNGEVVEPNTVSAALKHLWSTGGFRTKDVVLGVGNPKVLVRDLTVPRLSIKEIRAALPFQVQEILPVPVADALLDFYPVSEAVTESGRVVSGLLVAAVKEAVMSNVRATILAGLNPVEVDLIPFALTRVLARGPRSDGTVASVDVGATTTNVAITANGVPQFVRIIPVGGSDVTRALSGRLGITLEQAEIGKRQLGLISSPAAEHAEAAEVITELTRDLLNSLRNTLSFYVNSRQTSHIDRLVLSGGGSLLRNFPQALSELTRIPVVQESPFVHMPLTKGAADQEHAQQSINMSVALGLALRSAA